MPGIGTLEVVTQPAEYDFSKQRITAPKQRILFINAAASDHIFNEFSAISQLMKEKLRSEGVVEIAGLGSFIRDDDGSLAFESVEIDASLFQPVTAERVIHKDAEHAILVGDKETTNTEMTEYYTEDTSEPKDQWWIYAIVLAAAAIAAIGYYISQHGGIGDFSSLSDF